MSWILFLSIAGCQGLGLGSLDWGVFDFSSLRPSSQTPEEEDDDEFKTTVKTPMIGEYTTIAGLNLVTLQGVGLVTGLDGTGGDPPPSMYRTKILEEMRRRGVHNPNSILQSPSTALVIVRAYLPPLIRKGERFDVEVRIPGNSDATNLNGGWLMETYLSEQAVVPGRGILKGHVFAKAKGPILISSGEGDKASLAGVLRRGRVVGGGVAIKEDRNLALYLRNDFRSVRNASRVARRIGQRFFHYNRHGLREPLAEAKTDQKIELKVHPKYKDNFPRYLQVIRQIAFRETEVAQRVRIQKLERELLDPLTSQQAALKLEAIGNDSVPILKSGLKSPTLEVRFHSAMALAYLGAPDGLEVLAKAGREEPAFRVFAFAAMAAIDEVESHLLLRELMNERSAETRYGAFRALSTMDRNDPFIRGEKLNDQFMFHVLATGGPPMIHLTNRHKAELVLFGADQRFATPIAVRAGNHIQVNAPAGSDTITVSRYEVGKPHLRKTVSRRVADVIRTVAEFEASYPDVVQMLAQADRQLNLPGRIEIDALPRAGRVYYRPEGTAAKGSKSKTRVGSSKLTPNLFDTDRSSDQRVKKKPAEDSHHSQRTGRIETESEPKNENQTTSLADVAQSDSKQPTDTNDPNESTDRHHVLPLFKKSKVSQTGEGK